MRDIDPVQFKVMERGSSTPLETVDQKYAYSRLYPAALYLHQRQTYFVEELDLGAKVAWVVPQNPKQLNYYTEAREHSEVVILGKQFARPLTIATDFVLVLQRGGIMAHWEMRGFRKKAKDDHRTLDTIDLTLPPIKYSTHGLWMDIPGPVLQPVAEAGHLVDRGGLHALEHAMISLAPLFCDVDVGELACQHTRADTDPNRFLLLLYEIQKGGAGATVKLYEKWELLLVKAVQRIEDCPCEDGCPRCIVTSSCWGYNRGLDKVAAVMIGNALALSTQSKLKMSCLPSIKRMEGVDNSAEDSRPRLPDVDRGRGAQDLTHRMSVSIPGMSNFTAKHVPEPSTVFARPLRSIVSTSSPNHAVYWDLD